MAEKQKILIVDDKPANLFSLELVLKETGAEIIRAESGNDALVASLNHDFALALLDIQMPGMDGYELAELLRSEEKTRALPIIFVSAVYSSDHHMITGYDAGAVDFLVKPYNPKILLSKVRIFLKLDMQKKLLTDSKNELAKINDILKIKVHDKTSDLSTAIQELRTEMEKRKQAERQWQEIFEAIGHMTMIIDTDHTILAANRATLAQTGLSIEQVIGKKCCTIFHDSNQPSKKCPLETMLENDNYRVTESEIKALGRTYIVSCTPIFTEDGQLDKIIHIATDITARKQLKRELIQAHKMEAIGSLAGGIAHDFNNILSAVLGFTDLSLQKVEKGSQVEEDLQQVYAAGIRARDLVKQILNFARKTDEEPKPVRIDLVAKEVVKFLRSTIPSSIEINENITTKTLVLANPVKIHQLIMNLCTNAAYAMSERGLLTISLHDVVLAAEALPDFRKMLPGIYQRLEISDNGCGIPEDIIESIFQPFFTTKGIQEGTGMGLAMVHTIVKECGGVISVESTVGQGTVFTILLPTTNMEQKIEKLDHDQKLPMGTESILLVDDEAPICRLVSRMLTSCGYKVTTETDSTKALALFMADPDQFDLVITDMTMPNMSGDQLTAELLAVKPTIPIIIATGYNKRLSDPQAFEFGAKAFLAKPFEREGLTRTVEKVLKESSPGRKAEITINL